MVRKIVSFAALAAAPVRGMRLVSESHASQQAAIKTRWRPSSEVKIFEAWSGTTAYNLRAYNAVFGDCSTSFVRTCQEAFCTEGDKLTRGYCGEPGDYGDGIREKPGTGYFTGWCPDGTGITDAPSAACLGSRRYPGTVEWCITGKASEPQFLKLTAGGGREALRGPLRCGTPPIGGEFGSCGATSCIKESAIVRHNLHQNLYSTMSLKLATGYSFPCGTGWEPLTRAECRSIAGQDMQAKVLQPLIRENANGWSTAKYMSDMPYRSWDFPNMRYEGCNVLTASDSQIAHRFGNSTEGQLPGMMSAMVGWKEAFPWNGRLILAKQRGEVSTDFPSQLGIFSLACKREVEVLWREPGWWSQWPNADSKHSATNPCGAPVKFVNGTECRQLAIREGGGMYFDPRIYGGYCRTIQPECKTQMVTGYDAGQRWKLAHWSKSEGTACTDFPCTEFPAKSTEFPAKSTSYRV